MNKLKNALARRRHGLRALCVLAVVLAASVAINLLAERMETQWALRIDASANQFTQLSEETLDVLDTLNEEIHIYLIYQDATRNDLRANLETLLENYRARNARVKVDDIDPVTEPGRILKLVEDASTITEGSMIVTNADESRSRIIVAGELFNYKFNANSGAYEASSFIGENKLTSAILYVSSEDMSRVFFLTGHDEIASSYCTVLKGQLQGINYEVSDLRLDTNVDLQANDALIVIAPTVDLTESEYQILKNWLDAGGRLFYVNDPMADNERLTNFKRLLSYYNVSFADGLVIEDAAEADRYISSPMYLIPNIEAGLDITADMQEGRMLLPQSSAVVMPDMPLSGYEYEALLTTSDRAFIKDAESDSDIFTQDEGDPVGPFVLAMQILKQNDANDPSKDTRIVLVGTPYVMVDSNYLNSSYNLEFTMNVVEWLINRETGISIFAKPVASTALVLPNASVFWRLSALVVIAMPAVFLLLGITVWIKRRHL